MDNPTHTRRQKTIVRPQFEKRLAAYALASAAGLPILCAPSAQGAVVYTSVKASVGPGTTIPIDLDKDGVPDFGLNDFFSSGGGFSRDASIQLQLLNPTNSVVVDAADEGKALNLGSPIGPGLRFRNHLFYRLAKVAVTYEGVPYQDGEFLNKENKFLGLKIIINGAPHYGWARISTKVIARKIYVELSDYAYQDVPNRPIYAGQGIPKQEAINSLGALALGSDGVQLWRRDSN